MSMVNADLNALLQTVKNIQTAINSIEATKVSISTKYQHLGNGWNDKKYKDLGDIVNDCSKSLNTILKTLLQGEKYVALLVKGLQEYENVNFAGGNSQPTSNSSSNTTNSLSGNDNNATVKLAGKEWSDNLSLSERSAIRDYTGTSYVNINAVLRGLESDFDVGNHERASLIHSALSQSSIPQSCTVYRGASLSSLGNYANTSDEELIGNIISDDGFMSTSLNREDAFGGEVRYEISVPEGANGAYVGYLSHAQHYESEVLFDYGQMLQITDVRRDMFGNRTIVARMLV